MLRLSRKAWNNVIIISMLVLIVMFNTTSNFLNGDRSTEQASHLLASNAVITTMDFGDYKVERIGQGWRSIGTKASEDELVKLTEAWLTAQIDEQATELTVSQAVNNRIVTLWLVGKPNPIKFEVFQVADKTLVLTQQHLYQLRDTPFSSLFLAGATDA